MIENKILITFYNSSSRLSSSGVRISCMFDEMGLDIHNVESRKIRKLILVSCKNHLIYFFCHLVLDSSYQEYHDKLFPPK